MPAASCAVLGNSGSPVKRLHMQLTAQRAGAALRICATRCHKPSCPLRPADVPCRLQSYEPAVRRARWRASRSRRPAAVTTPTSPSSPSSPVGLRATMATRAHGCSECVLMCDASTDLAVMQLALEPLEPFSVCLTHSRHGDLQSQPTAACCRQTGIRPLTRGL